MTGIETAVLQVGQVEEVIEGIIAFIPRLIGAIIILLIGWFIGKFVGRFVAKLTDRIELDRMVLETPIGRMLGGSESAVSNALGTVAAWFIYALAVLAAANALAIEQLSIWIATAVSYLPAFIAGLLIIVIGFVVADFIGDAIERTRAATKSAYASWFANGTRFFLYFMAIVIGLDTMGIDVGILYVFARALAWGLAAALAIGIGLAIGWGGKDYVSENIDRWMGQAAAATPDPGQGTVDTTSQGTTEPDIGQGDTDEL